jgi:integrase
MFQAISGAVGTLGGTLLRDLVRYSAGTPARIAAMRSSVSDLPTASLVIATGRRGEPYFEAKWRAGGQVKRRIGPAWVEKQGGEWRPRRGRVPDGSYDEKRAIVRMFEIVREHAEERSREHDRLETEANRPVTFREVASDWLRWHEELSGSTPKTREDYRYMLAEPGAAWKDGKGFYAGLIMDALGDRPAAEITTTEIKKFLVSLDRAGKKARNVNKHRHVLHSIFNYAMKEDTFDLPSNPVAACEVRKEMPPAPLDFFEPDEIELLAQTAAWGRHRKPPVGRGGKVRELADEEHEARRAEDEQDADMFRVLAYTGMRIGEAVALRVGDVDLANRRIIVQRALSGSEESSTKGWKVRYVPIADRALEALARVLGREDFIQRDDYVFVNRFGGRLSVSAVRRRWHAARKKAGLRHMKLHGLRHGAGSMAARHGDAVFVKDFLGHSRMSTTERYMHAKARPQDVARLNAAFGSEETAAA